MGLWPTDAIAKRDGDVQKIEDGRSRKRRAGEFSKGETVMHTCSVSEMKGFKIGAKKDMPKEDSNIGRIIKVLLQNRGSWVSLRSISKHPGTAIFYLTDFYGFEIECTGRSTNAQWRLRGEYFGSKYVSYLIPENVEKERENKTS